MLTRPVLMLTRPALMLTRMLGRGRPFDSGLVFRRREGLQEWYRSDFRPKLLTFSVTVWMVYRYSGHLALLVVPAEDLESMRAGLESQYDEEEEEDCEDDDGGIGRMDESV
eukprot:231364_1